MIMNIKSTFLPYILAPQASQKDGGLWLSREKWGWIGNNVTCLTAELIVDSGYQEWNSIFFSF